VAAQRPFVFGMHVCNFADFKTGQGTIRATAMNDKALSPAIGGPKMAAHYLRSRRLQK